jgi:hypothetical protein
VSVSNGAVDVSTARELVTMGPHPRAESQLEGAVAIHNILQRENVAYLADEVGLGKTYVALAVLALFRHFTPAFRVLIIAPKLNIQRKWRNDYLSFVRENWKINDLRVKGAGGGPGRPVVLPERLSDVAYEAMVDDDRDFIARLTSFSFALNMTRERLIHNVRRQLPWLPARSFPDIKSIAGRDFVAQAYNASLPRFDLVIIDEAHNLAGGVRISDSGQVGKQTLRNAILAQVLGHPDVVPNARFAQTYRPIADRVLLLSATPVETSFSALWRQVHIVGKARGAEFDDLKSDDDTVAKMAARRILVRRINAIEVNGTKLTKNLYRRTWYQGGVSTYDEEMPTGSPRQRLTVALVQKKVADVIGAKYNNTFQMGMLASFESFAQTVLSEAMQLETEDDEDERAQSNFDNSEQGETTEERVGVDVEIVNQLLKSHVERFGREMAHPKMDSLVDALSDSWEDSSKALVFVRRIASVQEIKRKLDERCDQWLLARLERDLPAEAWAQIVSLTKDYRQEHLERGRMDTNAGSRTMDDEGGSDTFFRWFFRGSGPEERVRRRRLTIETGASLAEKLDRNAGGAATAFAHHRVCTLLACSPADALRRVTDIVAMPETEVLVELRRRAAAYLPVSPGRGHQFDAVQYATLELLADAAPEPWRRRARQLHQAISPVRHLPPGAASIDPADQLRVETFFTKVRAHPTLKAYFTLPPAEGSDLIDTRQQEFADAVVRAAVRLGCSHIDTYIAFMRASRARQLPSDDRSVADQALDQLLDILEAQRRAGDRSGAFWELSRLVDHLGLIRSKNLPETLDEGFLLRDAPRLLATALGDQRPIVGMHGRVNTRAVRQFRMPGYPLVVVCTDVLQEGEDLHLFCDRVIHYGVAWTPSSMEQRTGRVDRLYSLAERRFTAADEQARDIEGSEKIQVMVPYVPDTVEVLQSRRVFEQMHRFTTLMHEGAAEATRRLSVDDEINKMNWRPPKVEVPLKTGFEVEQQDLVGARRPPAVPASMIDTWWRRLMAVVDDPACANLFEENEPNPDLRAVYAWRPVGARVQPFTLRLTSRGALPLVQVLTPVGRVGYEGFEHALENLPGVLCRITVADNAKDREYDMAVEGDVILGVPEADSARVIALITRITSEADKLEKALTGRDLKLGEVRRTMGRDSRDA